MPVVPPPRKVAKIIPDYFTVDLPFIVQSTNIPASSLFFVNSSSLLRIRLNSIYDPIVGSVYDGIPQARDKYAELFKYYKVLKAEVKVTWISCYPPRNGTGHAIAAHPNTHHFAVGYELTDQDGAISNNCHMFLTTKHAKRDIISPAPTTQGQYWNGTTAVRYEYPINPTHHVQTFTYVPSNWDYHVHERSEEERWTPIGANPCGS